MHRRDFLHLSGMPLLVSALSASRARVQSARPDPVVETATGRLRGRALDGVVTFKGIRYGASTGGANRLQLPVKPRPWTGILDAIDFGPRAWQPFRAMIPEIGDALTGSGRMDEDCLRVNVWTPRRRSRPPAGDGVVPWRRAADGIRQLDLL
jgi:para-nitrobenzyl esterase